MNTVTEVAVRASARAAFPILFAAWLVAFGATLGALFIGEVLGQTPCTLCWYQRIAMFPLALVLGIACLNEDTTVRRYAVPLALAGGAVALWHPLLYVGLIEAPLVPCSANGPSCTGSSMTIFGVIPLPVISLASFALIVVLLVLFPPSRETKSP